QSLSVGFYIVQRQHRLGPRPQYRFDFFFAGKAGNAECPGEYPFYIAVENGSPRAKRKYGYGSRRRSPDSWQGNDVVERRGKYPLVPLHYCMRRSVQIASAGVVAEPAP